MELSNNQMMISLHVFAYTFIVKYRMLGFIEKCLIHPIPFSENVTNKTEILYSNWIICIIYIKKNYLKM